MLPPDFESQKRRSSHLYRVRVAHQLVAQNRTLCALTKMPIRDASEASMLHADQLCLASGQFSWFSVLLTESPRHLGVAYPPPRGVWNLHFLFDWQTGVANIPDYQLHESALTRYTRMGSAYHYCMKDAPSNSVRPRENRHTKTKGLEARLFWMDLLSGCLP